MRYGPCPQDAYPELTSRSFPEVSETSPERIICILLGNPYSQWAALTLIMLMPLLKAARIHLFPWPLPTLAVK